MRQKGLKKRGKTGGLGKPIVRQPLVEIEEPVTQRAELISFPTTNSNIIQQLQLITRFPFVVDEEMRSDIVATIKKCMQSEDDKVRVAAAAAGAKLIGLNLGVFKQLASDQVQRHLSFDRQTSIEQSRKQKVLDEMTDEELELMERMADKLGGVVTVEAQ